MSSSEEHRAVSPSGLSRPTSTAPGHRGAHPARHRRLRPGRRHRAPRARVLQSGALPPRSRQRQHPGAGATGLEPATSGVTGRRSNQLSYAPWVGTGKYGNTAGATAPASGQVLQRRRFQRVSARPAADVVVPFRGSPEQLEQLAERLGTLVLRDGDSVTIADNRPEATDTQRGAVTILGAGGAPDLLPRAQPWRRRPQRAVARVHRRRRARAARPARPLSRRTTRR